MAKQYGILVDIDSCIGCGVCIIACKQEHDLPPHTDDRPSTTGLAWNQVVQITDGKYPDISIEYLYVQCMHCAAPPCVQACPKDAIHKREDGIVLIAEAKCNACVDQPDGVKKCIPACPYGAIQFNEEKGAAQACTLCVQRIDEGLEPDCVRACEANCLTFGDFNDPNSEVFKKMKEVGDRVFVLKPEKETNPSLRYIRPPKMRLDKVSSIDKAETVYGFKKQG